MRGLRIAVTFFSLCGLVDAATVSGTVRRTDSSPIPGARVTLFTPDLSSFRESRTAPDGSYAFGGTPAGNYRVGAAALDFEYREGAVDVAGADVSADFVLGPDVHPGRWSEIGNTDPEALFASNSAVLLPDGTIMFCHDTLEPVVFDPRNGAKRFPPQSPSQQGCTIQTLLEDGRVIFVGGQGSDDFRDAVRTVKAYSVSRNAWDVLPSLGEPRWYPGMTPLSDGRLLVMGGGQPPDARRTATCEIFDPVSMTWAPTGSMSRASDYPPAVLLLTGDVLRSWYPPQIYEAATGLWRDTDGLVQPDRFWPGHCDHMMLLLADGRAMICGVYRGTLPAPSMVELFDPATETWGLGATPESTRSQPEVVLLPTGHVLCAGGRLEDDDPSIETNEFGQTKLADLYDPDADRWRRLADMTWFREYHATTLLLPDGRVLTTAGTGSPALPGVSNSIEAFEPPYLFRGVRPRIDAISSTDLLTGTTVSLSVSRTDAVTSVVLVGTGATTHWVDGGVPRLLRLPFTQTGSTVDAEVPSDPIVAMPGAYLLFVFVDDVPSESLIVRVLSGRCRGGNVNARTGPIADVVRVNGSAGIGADRRVSVGVGAPLRIDVAAPPSRASAPFAIYATLGEPSEETRAIQSRPGAFLGVSCFPTPLDGGAPSPKVIFNNIGRRSLLGVPDFPSSPAPAVLVDRPAGMPRALTVTLHGFIRDDASAGPEGFSLTNEVILEIM